MAIVFTCSDKIITEIEIGTEKRLIKSINILRCETLIITQVVTGFKLNSLLMNVDAHGLLLGNI